MKPVNRCTNMNHGRMNAPIKFCPVCGEVVNREASARCDSGKHADMRRQRLVFCHDCGKKLA
jgi:hypothetical protein